MIHEMASDLVKLATDGRKKLVARPSIAAPNAVK
jgi:hypothetical protein